MTVKLMFKLQVQIEAAKHLKNLVLSILNGRKQRSSNFLKQLKNKKPESCIHAHVCCNKKYDFRAFWYHIRFLAPDKQPVKCLGNVNCRLKTRP